MLALPPKLPAVSVQYDPANERAFREALTRYFQQQRTDAAVADPSQAASPLDGTLVKAIGGGVLGLTNLRESGTVLTIGDSIVGQKAAAFRSTLTVAGATALAAALSVGGAASLASTLGVTGAASLASTLEVTGAVGMATTLAVGLQATSALALPDVISTETPTIPVYSGVVGRTVDFAATNSIKEFDGPGINMIRAGSSTGANTWSSRTQTVNGSLLGFYSFSGQYNGTDSHLINAAVYALAQEDFVTYGTHGLTDLIFATKATGTGTANAQPKWRVLGNGNLVPQSDTAGTTLGEDSTPRRVDSAYLKNYLKTDAGTGSGGIVHWWSRSTGSVLRWGIGQYGTETGSNAGADWSLWGYSDTGTLLGQWLKVTRATGAATLLSTLSATQYTSTIATGTAPLVVASTTAVANLNADLLDGQHGAFYAPLASPTFTGTPAAPTATPGTNTTQLATTAFVQAATGALVTGVSSVFGRTGAVVAVAGDYGPTLGGTGQTSYTLGDTLYSSATNVLAKLAGNTTTTKKYLSQTGTGSVSAAPAWAQVAFADLSGTIASGQVSGSYTGITGVGTLASGAVPASLVTAGMFGAGAYTFPSALAITGALSGVTTLAISSDVTYSDSSWLLAANTADGADTSRAFLVGGGAPSISRGGYVAVSGNENATTPGNVLLIAGSTGFIQTLGNIIPTNDGDTDLGSATKQFNRLYLDNQLVSSLATGTSPFAVTSTTVNTNLNADLLDGQHGSYYSAWANLTGTPTTLAGYGITDAVTVGTTQTITGAKTFGDNVAIGTVGKGLKVKEGTNAKMGTAVLVGGTVVVSTTAVTASSRIYLTVNTPGGTVGAPYVSARTAGTSFTITSTSATDTSTVAWFIVEPA